MPKFTLTILFLLGFSAQSHAGISNNCTWAKDSTSKISSVSLGVDDGADVNISFTFTVGSISKSVSVKRTIGDSAGHGMYQLLLSAYLTQTPVKIERCDTDQVVGASLVLQ